MNVPENWKAFGNWNWEQIRKHNVAVTTPHDLQSQNLSVVLRLQKDCALQIYSDLQQDIPSDILEKIIAQPYEGYHFTLQWTPSISPDKEQKLSSRLKELNFDIPTSGTMVHPVLGKAGILGIVDDQTAKILEELRSKIYEVFTSLNISAGLLPDFFPLGYVSLSRYSAPFTDMDFEALKAIEAKSKNPIQFESILLGKIDKFITLERSEIIWERTCR